MVALDDLLVHAQYARNELQEVLQGSLEPYGKQQASAECRTPYGELKSGFGGKNIIYSHGEHILLHRCMRMWFGQPIRLGEIPRRAARYARFQVQGQSGHLLESIRTC